MQTSKLFRTVVAFSVAWGSQLAACGPDLPPVVSTGQTGGGSAVGGGSVGGGGAATGGSAATGGGAANDGGNAGLDGGHDGGHDGGMCDGGVRTQPDGGCGWPPTK
jgi:hypothetical protein